MTAIRPSLTLALLSALAATAAVPRAAAETYQTCAGFITSLPATITTQGTWCLRQDLATAVNSGAAITIATNNVTLDCNGFKVGGLAAGNTSQASGIFANARQNVTLRNCGVRGFMRGINLSGGAGHLIEDNRLDNNLATGIWVGEASNGVIRRNRVYDTGGYPDNQDRHGIRLFVDAFDVLDNTIGGVYGTAGWYNSVYGIDWGNNHATADYVTGRIAGNRISHLVPTGNAGQTAFGIRNQGYGGTSSRMFAIDNQVVLTTTVANSIGFRCNTSAMSVSRNQVWGFQTGIHLCVNEGDNLVK